MSNIQENPRAPIPSIWERLRLAFEDISDSHTERLEKRVRWLEAEVERLSVVEATPVSLSPKR